MGPLHRPPRPFPLLAERLLLLHRDLTPCEGADQDGNAILQAIDLLEAIRTQSKDDRERAWALALLVQCKSNVDRLDAIEEIAREGIATADRAGEAQALAICQAELGVILCRKYAELALELHTVVLMARTIGILTLSEQDLLARREALTKTWAEADITLTQARF